MVDDDTDVQPGSEWLAVGEKPPPGGRPGGSRRGRRVLAVVVALALITGGASVAIYQHRTARSSPPPAPSVTSTPYPTGSRSSRGGGGRPTASRTTETVDDVGFALPADTVLIGYGPHGLLHLDPTRRELTTWPDVSLPAEGYLTRVVSAMAGTRVVAGYGGNRDQRDQMASVWLPRGGDPTVGLPGALSAGEVLGVTTDGARLWVGTREQDGRVTHVVAVDPATGEESADELDLADLQVYDTRPDPAGGVITFGTGGVYLLDPQGARRVTTGALLAAGPTGFLVDECDVRGGCRVLLRDRALRDVLELPGDDAARLRASGTDGVISPDGRWAALTVADRTTSAPVVTTLVLVDLTTGATRELPRVVSDGPGDLDRKLWTPDSGRLLRMTVDGLQVIDPATARVSVVRGIPSDTAVIVLAVSA